MTSHSKYLSLLLRHNPGLIGLTLDGQGWAVIDELIELSQKKGKRFTRELLEEIVATDNKQRYTFSPDGQKIRANQGHSIDIDLGLTPQAPPGELYHGTAGRFLDSILREGLKPGTRQHVHLSRDIHTARNVGQRHGKPVILTVDTAQMAADGFQFYLSENGVWLTEHVPPIYLKTDRDKRQG